jgi:uncharacterized phage-associated protein
MTSISGQAKKFILDSKKMLARFLKIFSIIGFKKTGDDPMPSVFDVANYVLKQTGNLSTIKLQKIIYYCQAWSLVWDDDPLFPEKIEAWANGPVVRELFDAHKGKFKVGQDDIHGCPEKLTPNQKETIDIVLKSYGNKPAQWLVDLTHLEEPWKKARGDAGPGDWCNCEISHADMAEYYSGILRDD